MRERAGVFFLVENTNKKSQQLTIDTRGTRNVYTQGFSRVEVTDDDDGSDLSKVAGLHLGLADVKDAFHRFNIPKLKSVLFALHEELGPEGWKDVADDAMKTVLT